MPNMRNQADSLGVVEVSADKLWGAVTALSSVAGYDKASKITHYAMRNDLALKEAALKLGSVIEAEFDRVVNVNKMMKPYVAPSASP